MKKRGKNSGGEWRRGECMKVKKRNVMKMKWEKKRGYGGGRHGRKSAGGEDRELGERMA